MSCVQPRPAVKERNLETGKFSIDFNPRDWASREAVFLPCGKCLGCRADQSLTWAIRCYHESLEYSQCSFLTLTYADPCPSDLRPEDLRNFWKRLRKVYKIRYFACGEYGGLTHRPHYHALVFGKDFLEGSVRHCTGTFYHPELDRFWGHGFVDVGSVEFASILYVAGYASKKIGDEDTFIRMSRNPPLGKKFFDRYSDDLRRIGSVVIEGVKYPIPKRYFDWDLDDSLAAVKDSRSESFRGQTPDDRALRARRLNFESKFRSRSEKI